ncbi:MAG: alpha-galactosidase [Arachnia sp.]
MDSRIALHAGGVSLLLATEQGRLPEVLHWGADVGTVDEGGFDAIVDGNRWPVVPNTPDEGLILAVLPEGRYGWQGKPGLIGSRDGLDWTPDWHLTDILIDGAPLTDAVTNLGPSVLTYRAAAEAAGLALAITVEMLPQGLVRARAELTNLGEQPYRVDELTLAFPVPAQAREVMDFAGRWGNERIPQRRALTVGTHRREARHGRTGADSAYILHLGDLGFGFAHGQIWSVHTAWSGNHLHFAERDQSGAQLIGGGELLLPGEGTLLHGASYATPWLYANWGVGLDVQAGRFHDFLRDRDIHTDADRPVTLNVWEAVYFDHDPDRLLDLAERAALLGVERYVLDDGWFGSRRDDHSGLGDWVVSTDVWPGGLHPLVDRVHQLAMQFGLWFEPEMVNIDSDVARQHPEWIMQPAGRLPIESRFQQVLNLSVDGAFQHVLGQMSAVFDEYGIDYVKWDHNRDLIDACTAPLGRPAVHAQTLAFYRLLDELRARHPHIEFESCSSGGARIDLEVLQRTERVWVSDNIDPEERQRMLLWTGQLLPPELMGSHIASGRSHTTGRLHDLDFRAATAVSGHLGVEWDLGLATDDELVALAWWIDWYKANRRVLLTGRVHRVDMPDDDVVFKGVVTRNRAIFSLSMLQVTDCSNLGRLHFPGLDDEATYRVTMSGRNPVPEAQRAPWQAAEGGIQVSGRHLARVGLRCPVLRPATAVLFELDRL